jgi:hypothetical protein
VICLDKYARQRSLICKGSPSNAALNFALKELDSLTKTLVLPGGICYHYAFKFFFGNPDSVDQCDHLPTSCGDKCSVYCDGSFTKMLIPVKRSELTKMLKRELNGVGDGHFVAIHVFEKCWKKTRFQLFIHSSASIDLSVSVLVCLSA